MLSIAQCFLPLIMLVVLSQVALVAVPPQTTAGQATEQEGREARDVAMALVRRMQEARDIASVKDLYVADFARRYMEAERASSRYYGSSFSFDWDLLRQNRDEWERFYAAQVNLRYFMVLYIASTQTPTNDLQIEAFPPDVVAILNANPFLTANPAEYRIETLEELRGVMTTLEKAGAAMRERFAKNPPEQKRLYKEWVRASEQEQGVMRPYLEVTSVEMFGFPKGTRFFHLLTIPPLFELKLVKTNEGMKIFSASVYPFN